MISVVVAVKRVSHGDVSTEVKYDVVTRVPFCFVIEKAGNEPVCGRHVC